jgi:hypothetical protein
MEHHPILVIRHLAPNFRAIKRRLLLYPPNQNIVFLFATTLKAMKFNILLLFIALIQPFDAQPQSCDVPITLDTRNPKTNFSPAGRVGIVEAKAVEIAHQHTGMNLTK